MSSDKALNRTTPFVLIAPIYLQKNLQSFMLLYKLMLMKEVLTQQACLV